MNTFLGPVSTGPYPHTYRYDQLRFVLGYEDIEMARKMLLAGADIEARSSPLNDTPLHFAVCKRMFEKAKLLLENGANVNVVTGSWGITPLHSAASNGNSAETAQLLIDYGADMEARDGSGATPLVRAANNRNNGYAPVAEVLLKNGADVNAFDRKGMTPFHYAVGNGHVDVVHILIEYGANMLIVSNDCRTAEDMIKLLYTRDPEAAVLIEAEIERARAPLRAAFAMGNHERLGERSLVQWLSAEEMRMVFDQM
jgi:ankyrin repeat protein